MPATAVLETRQTEYNFPQPQTLEELVLMSGLNVIPLNRVREYQNRLKAEYEAKSTEMFTYCAHWKQIGKLALRNAVRNERIPAEVRTAVRRAWQIPGTFVYAERILYNNRPTPDPFYFVAGIYNGKFEVVCFAFHDAPGFSA